jgi:hypothetical protein
MLITRHIHNISSVCKHCHCSGNMVVHHKRAEFAGPLGRHGCHLQTTEPRLCIVLCVYNIQENQEACHIWNVVCNLLLECKKRETGWYSSSTLWSVWRICNEWFNGMELGENLMKDAKMMIRGAFDRLWLMNIWCVQWKRWFKRIDDSPFRHFPCVFSKFSRSLLHEIVSDKLRGLHRRRHHSTIQDTKTGARYDKCLDNGGNYVEK